MEGIIVAVVFMVLYFMAIPVIVKTSGDDFGGIGFDIIFGVHFTKIMSEFIRRLHVPDWLSNEQAAVAIIFILFLTFLVYVEIINKTAKLLAKRAAKINGEKSGDNPAESPENTDSDDDKEEEEDDEDEEENEEING